MKLFMLSDPDSIHTKRWVYSLSEKGIEIFLFGVNQNNDCFYNQCKNTTVYAIDYTSKLKRTSLKKVKYLYALSVLRKKIKEYQPDILHAHYASSYGLLGALSKFHPYILSVWGSDIYDFPNISFLHKAILKYNISKTDYLLSTSSVMAKETKKYTNNPIEITPFGVDLKLFNKMDILKQKDEFIIGTVKTLAQIYGQDILIKSFKQVQDNNPNLNLKMRIIGDGPDKKKLQLLTCTLGLEEYIDFLGKIENKLLPNYYNSFSVFVSLSDKESFGVAAVEAMACECPVVVSNADGFTEVVVDGVTGFIVPKRDIEATSLAIQKIIDDSLLRESMGKKGRKRVEQLYDWDKNVEQMIQFYNRIRSS